MASRTLRSRILFSVGALGFVLGSLDPLEGAPLVLAGAAALALAAYLRRSRYRTLLLYAVPLMAAGIAAMFALSARGGLGGPAGRSMWWALLMIPYPAGWLMTAAAAILAVSESFRDRAHAAP